MSYRTHCAQRRYADECRASRRLDRFAVSIAPQLRAFAVVEHPAPRVAPSAILPSYLVTWSRHGVMRPLPIRRPKGRAA